MHVAHTIVKGISLISSLEGGQQLWVPLSRESLQGGHEMLVMDGVELHRGAEG